MHRESKISVGSTAFLVWIIFSDVFQKSVSFFVFGHLLLFLRVRVQTTQLHQIISESSQSLCGVDEPGQLPQAWMWLDAPSKAQKKNREALGPRIPSNFRSMAHFLRWMCLAFLISPSLISLIQHVSGRQESFLSGEDHCLIVYPSKPTKCRPLREM